MRIKEGEHLLCNSCSTTFREFNESDVLRVCPACGSMDWELVNSDDLEAKRLEEIEKHKWRAKEL